MKWVTVVVSCLLVDIIQGNIHSKLHYFETLKSLDVKSRERRSADGNSIIHKEVSFSALGRKFDMMIEPDSSIFSDSFKAYVVKSDHNTEPFHLNKNEFFKGHLIEEDGDVNAHLEDSIWNILVSTKDDVYAIEPSWRHLPPSDNHTLIAYRHSDIKWDHAFPDLAQGEETRHKICEDLHADFPAEETEDLLEKENDTEHTVHERQKRQAWLVNKNTCNLLLVADHKFNKYIGDGFKHRTSNYLVGLMQRLETIYRQTNWDPDRGHIGFGFQLKEMRIHDDPTVVSKGEIHYNMAGEPTSEHTWDTRLLLEEFSTNTYFRHFCLAHLFTYQKFPGGVLGLAYIASRRPGTIGGICSPSHMRHTGKRMYLNTGWSSSMNTGGGRQLTQESMLVTAHELGHNWGSEHDADTAECAPNSFQKGKFIMYPYAVSGWEENNYVFSPCSKRYVSDVLRQKAFTCFEEKKDNFPYCGNSIVDKGEDCDAGSDGDECCTSRCRFRRGAQCSQVNYECCENCQMAPSTFDCRLTTKFSCFRSTKCNGTSFDCPPPAPKDEDSECVDDGKCKGGKCKSFCELRNMEPCICSNLKNACSRCCKPHDGSQSECREMGVLLPEGRPCIQGYCSKEGECKKNSTELVFRFFDFIEKLTPSKFVEIMRSNIVGTVIVLSLFVWIPASWIFSCIDKRKLEEDKDFTAWRNSRYLFVPDESFDRRIRESKVKRIGRTYPSRTRTLSGSSRSVNSIEHETTV